ncbi:predicted protein [Naegleria gruberi]|uniref:Predicted protein n=1 Tax=Naegleria gruberi TaxID=5762 RepID=D2VLU9_NAEGR|nr:uncharacterized protein NAEGRDRAFT_69907 [Naegleria gruberi]EFC42119.1 predicted protein [Naegleria gruberi]|eukprot:XP_002674863.1 predicted protein [Naegleria gruberi strain NEG-M]
MTSESSSLSTTILEQVDMLKDWIDHHLKLIISEENKEEFLSLVREKKWLLIATPPLLMFLSSMIKLYGNYRKVKQIPGGLALFFSPFKIPFLAPVFYMGNWNGMIEYANEKGDGEGNVRVSFVGFNYFLVTRERALMKEILLNKQAFLDKPSIVYDMFNVFGENIVSALTIDSWKRHHRVCNAAFSVENLKYMCGQASKVTDLLTDLWEERLKNGNGEFMFDCDDFSMVTLEVLGLAGFNMSFGVFDKNDESGGKFKDAVEKIFTVGMLMRRFLGGTPILYPLAQRIFGVSHALEIINKKLDAAIEDRRKEMEENIDTFSKSDILSLLVKANSKENLLTDQELKSNTLIFVLAGEEWVIYELAKNPQYQEKAREEIERVLSERIPSYDDYDNLDLLNCIFLETLRLHPAAAGILKQANKTITIGKYTIPKDTIVDCSIVGVQTSESVWPEASVFKPERWLDREFRSKAQHDYSFLSFSTGLRKCIGFNFSKMEACMILARVLKKYKFELLNNEAQGDIVVGSKGVTTRPENLKVKVTKL